MRQQACWFHCDTKDCDEKSPHEANFSDARNTAAKLGWMIHPSSGENQKHVGPKCVERMMTLLEPPATEAPHPPTPTSVDEEPF